METFEALKTIIVDKLGVDENEVTPEASFTDNLDAGIFDVIEIIIECESRFDIVIHDYDNFETVGDAVKIIESELSKK